MLTARRQIYTASHTRPVGSESRRIDLRLRNIASAQALSVDGRLSPLIRDPRLAEVPPDWAPPKSWGDFCVVSARLFANEGLIGVGWQVSAVGSAKILIARPRVPRYFNMSIFTPSNPSSPLSSQQLAIDRQVRRCRSLVVLRSHLVAASPGGQDLYLD